jgi:Holliday junction DNA helicase RuvA
MISRIKGIVTDKKIKLLEVMIASGISFEVYTPNSFYFIVGKEYDFFIVALFNSEKGYSLYGFHDEKAKIFFKELQECRGIGPKLALAILENLSIKDFYTALFFEKKEILSEVSGIGKKKAELIIIELKSKISLFQSLCEEPEIKEISPSISMIEKDLEEALIKIGFQKGETKKMIEKVFREKNPLKCSIGELLSDALSLNIRS